VGFAGLGASLGSSKIAVFASFGRYIFRKFIYEIKIIMSKYVFLQWVFIDIETDDLEILNDLE